MIFVTVGTHEQQFNRLVKYIDDLRNEGIINEEIIIQTGYSTYVPKCCEWYKLIPFDEMQNYIRRARIVITHGGPASFIMPLQMGKTPIVVPRQLKYNEHVNDHQLDFSSEVSKRMKNILLVERIEELADIIITYDETIEHLNYDVIDNNAKFNEKFENVVTGLFMK